MQNEHKKMMWVRRGTKSQVLQKKEVNDGSPKCHLSHLIFTAHLVQLVKQVCLVVVQSLMKVSHTFQYSVCTPEPKLQSLHHRTLRKS